MRQCVHERKGIVVNKSAIDPGPFQEKCRASRATCDRNFCIAAAKAWVAARANEEAVYRPDPVDDRTGL